MNWVFLNLEDQGCFCMICLDFDWQIDEFMVYCRSSQLRPKTMQSYEQTLRLFERWCLEQLDIRTVDKVTESVIRHYIRDLQERGKYTFYAVESQKETNHPDRRRDFRKPIATTSINNYIRNLRVFFNWLERNYIIKKNPMKKIVALFYRNYTAQQEAVTPNMQRLRSALKAYYGQKPIAQSFRDAFREKILSMGGYTLENPGEIIALD